VISITAGRADLSQNQELRCVMPIFFMAVIALALFVGMGLMLFYATYCEVKEAHHVPGKTKKI
jgi:hypothetical protein